MPAWKLLAWNWITFPPPGPGAVADHGVLSYALLAMAVLLSAWVQGFSGLGFGMIAASVLTQVIPGSSGIGLVNTPALAQNAWQVSREEGVIHWSVLKRMGTGLLGVCCLGCSR